MQDPISDAEAIWLDQSDSIFAIFNGRSAGSVDHGKNRGTCERNDRNQKRAESHRLRHRSPKRKRYREGQRSQPIGTNQRQKLRNRCVDPDLRNPAQGKPVRR